jgi:hypothetical protein
LNIAYAKDPQTYKSDLWNFKIILSADDEKQVLEWLLDPNSGYPDLADKLIFLLNNTNPRGTSTVLDAIMGKLKIVNGKTPNDYVPPPYKAVQVKEAYVKNWKERNTGAWKRLPKEIQDDYNKTFNYIVSPYTQQK